MKRKLLGGNWKLACNLGTLDMAERLKDEEFSGLDAFIAVPAVYIAMARGIFPPSISLGAQDVSEYEAGPYTGEISAKMLKGEGIEYAIIGHSERRIHFGESCETVANKLQRCLENNLKPVLCIGEPEEYRKSGKHLEFLKEQLRNSVGNSKGTKVDIAYEPIWAIGREEAATTTEIKEVAESIREWMGEMRLLGRIIYGGAVSEINIGEFSAMESIDGVLVGSASLTKEFSKIAQVLGKSTRG